MSRKRTPTTRLTADLAYSPHVQAVLYDILIVATPLVMVRAFMQQFVLSLTRYSFTLSGVEFPTVPTLVAFLSAVLLVAFRRHITGRRVLAAAIVLVMMALAHRISDFYTDLKFYDIQQNWHYFAYMLFSVVIYRDHMSRGLPVAKMLVTAYLVGFTLSAFDELFQLFMSSRVFDLGDVAKDCWGVSMGLILVYVGGGKWEEMRSDLKAVHYPRLRDYWTHPFPTLLLIIVHSFIFLNVASLMTDPEHVPAVLLIASGLFIVFYLLVHLTRFAAPRYVLSGALMLAAIGQIWLCLSCEPDRINFNRFGITVYRGIVIPFFDVMIYPDGKFCLVDKKHDFNSRDRHFFMKKGADITLIGSGAYGKGGNGYPRKSPSQYLYDSYTRRVTQVIILDTPSACRTFNRLKSEGKHVLFILHNTC
jgi:hypothetical protein